MHQHNTVLSLSFFEKIDLGLGNIPNFLEDHSYLLSFLLVFFYFSCIIWDSHVRKSFEKINHS